MSVTLTTKAEPQDHSPQWPWQASKYSGAGGRDTPTEGERIEAWFEDAIWTDFRICSHCFQAIKSDCWMEWTDSSGREKDMAHSWRVPTATLGEDLKEAPDSVPNHTPLPTGRTTCLDCGSVGGIAQSDALSRQAARDRVPNLVTRLHERGHAVDEYRVYGIVDHLKANPEYTDNDKRVFATAAAMGIKHG